MYTSGTVNWDLKCSQALNGHLGLVLISQNAIDI